MSGLFGLTASERKALEPLPPGASMTRLVNRLYQLESLRGNTLIKMGAPETRAIDMVRYQADVTVISAAIQTTALRARTAWIRSAATRFPTRVRLPLEAWLTQLSKS